MNQETRYQALFSTPEKMAAYIVSKCGFDCGMFPDQENFDKVLAWLNESHQCKRVGDDW